jgi:hypothetical protein
VAGPDQLGHDAGGLAVGRRPGAQVLVEHRRLPHGDAAGPPGGPVVVDRVDLVAPERSGQRAGIADGGRRADEGGVGPVVGGHPAQPTEQVGDVAAEHATEDVELVDHDVAQPAQERGPALVVREEPGVEHLGVGQHHGGVAADPGPLLRSGVAVVGAGDHSREPEGAQGPELVVRQCLGGEDGQRGAGPHGRGGGLRDGQLVAEGLARRRAGGHHHRPSRPGQVDGLRLVRPERARGPLADLVGSGRARSANRAGLAGRSARWTRRPGSPGRSGVPHAAARSASAAVRTAGASGSATAAVGEGAPMATG